jgi:hypothetical protein
MTMLIRIGLAVTMVLSLSRPGTAADTPQSRVELSRLEDEARIAFAIKFFYKHYPHQVNWSFATRRAAGENWNKIVRDDGYFAEIDLNDDGVPELILVIDNPDWCGSSGCLTAIFRTTPKGYEYICAASMPAADQPGAEILAERENGYHRIATPTRVIEWNAKQEPDSGSLCAEETREP